MLYEFEDLIDPRMLPGRRKELMYYLVGFTDAEGCFSVSLKKQEGTRFGWVLDPVFHVTQHKSNRIVLEIFRRTLMCGRIIEKHGQPDTLVYIVDNRRQLAEKVIPFFRRHRLILKHRDFERFAEIVEALEEKKHATAEGFRELVQKAFEMNMAGKQRRYTLEEILSDIASVTSSGSSEAIRRTPREGVSNAEKGRRYGPPEKKGA